MILEDTSLEEALGAGDLVVQPIWPHAIQPNSIDLHLGDTLRRVRGEAGLLSRSHPKRLVDVTSEVLPLEHYPHGQYIMLRPGEFALGSTVEAVHLSAALMGWVVGTSSVARGGLMIQTAGLVDAGFFGTLTLELTNLAAFPLILAPGERIGQLVVARLVRPAARPYGSGGLGSRYQGQQGATAALPPIPQYVPRDVPP